MKINENFIIKIKENKNIIIPSICICLWLAIYIIIIPNKLIGDFNVFYRSGQLVLENPQRLYKEYPFVYMPSFAFFFAITFSIIPFYPSYYLWLIFNCIMGIIMIHQFNRILSLINIKSHIRSIFLIILSNGWLIYEQFLHAQMKLIVSALLLIILRRELKYRELKIIRNLKYFFINFFLFIFAIGLAPFLFLYLLVYLFYDIKYSEFFNKLNIEKYILICILFSIQNFLFYIFPSMIYNFIICVFEPSSANRVEVHLFYLFDFLYLPPIFNFYLNLLILLIFVLITLILIFKRKIMIEIKFGILSLFFIVFGIWGVYYTLIIFFPPFLLLYVKFLKQEFKCINFIKKNKIIVIGLIGIVGINFSPPSYLVFKLIPFLNISPINFLIYMRRLIFLIMILISLGFLYLNKNFTITNKIIENKSKLII